MYFSWYLDFMGNPKKLTSFASALKLTVSVYVFSVRGFAYSSLKTNVPRWLPRGDTVVFAKIRGWGTLP